MHPSYRDIPPRGARGCRGWFPWFMAIASLSFMHLQQSHIASISSADLIVADNSATARAVSHLIPTTLTSSDHRHIQVRNPLQEEYWPKPATPLTALSDEARTRQGVEGHGNPIHLGGALGYDEAASTISISVFELILQQWGVQSVVDIGCGRGWSSLWFHLQGIQTLCVDGSNATYNQSVLPLEHRVLHDFTRGPWWPDETVDLVWSTNFVQQVSRPYAHNYLTAMSKAAILLLSFPTQPGWHSVEVHDLDWWTLQFEREGFVRNEFLTRQVRQSARSEGKRTTMGPNGLPMQATDLVVDTIVFLNTRVASLPAHTHLFREHGCFRGFHENGSLIHRQCNTGAGTNLETPLNGQFAPRQVNATKSQLWVSIVREHLNKSHRSTTPNEASRLVTAPVPHLENASSPTNISYHAILQVPSMVMKGNRSVSKIPVVVWPLWEFGPSTAEALHMEQNGVNESPFLELSEDIFNLDPNVVWVGDAGYAYGWDTWCDKFLEHILRARSRRLEYGLPGSWPIYIVDWTDYDNNLHCPDIDATMGKEYVFYSKRSLTEKRYWNKSKRWVELGRLFNQTFPNGPIYQHTPLVVRTDTIQSLKDALTRRGLTLKDRIEALERPVDVTHLWPLNPSEENSGVGDIKSNLRTLVSKIVVDLGNQSDLNVFVGLAGDAAHTGRRGVASDYIESLLRTKIILVTQRDRWEDHYRLFEALISGALVITDRMLTLPAGLKNGTSILEYTSADELRSLISYYAKNPEERQAIAYHGRRVAMMRHRTWHRIEEIIFGIILTTCLEKNATGDCPYIVHANEAFLR